MELISKASSTELDIIVMILVEFCRIFSWSHTFLDHPPQMDPFRLKSIFQFALFIRHFHSVSLDIYISVSLNVNFSFPFVKQTFWRILAVNTERIVWHYFTRTFVSKYYLVPEL